MVLLAGILVAGLWPFQAPKNAVSWLKGENGVRFGQHGTIVSSRAFENLNGDGMTSGSLELWLRPDHSYETRTLLAFYKDGNPGGFSLHQDGTELALENEAWNHRISTRLARLNVEDVFHRGQSVFITVVSDGHLTTIYLNGHLARESRDFTFSTRDLTGRLIIANSPVEDDSWMGALRGLALYDSGLNAAEVLRHYQAWTGRGRPDVTAGERAAAVYLFDEQSGRVIRNQAESRLDLSIPKRYSEVHHAFLEAPWNEYTAGLIYWKDIAINIGGFIPLGFCFYAYLLLGLQNRRAAFATVLLGAAVSLTIEVLQSFLPTRYSGLTDIITNTLGTGIGVVLYRWTGMACRHFRFRHASLVHLVEVFVSG